MAQVRPIPTILCLAALAAAVVAAFVAAQDAEASGRAGLTRRARAFAEAMEGGARGGIAFVQPRLAPMADRQRTAEALGILSGRTLMPARVGVEADGRGSVVFEVVEASRRGLRIVGRVSTAWWLDRGAGIWWLVGVE